MAGISFKNIKKSYGDVKVVHGITLDIQDGEFIVIVGPSGCGKSTLLRMVAGLEPITSGELTIGDRVVNNLAPKARDCAMVFQNYALYPHMTVFDNMAYGLKIRGVPKEEIRRRVEEAAKMLELGHLLPRRPRQLSGGQRQRVAMGRAIVREPAVFLFDEPLSNLDAKLRVQTRLQIKKLHQRLKTTSLYVTHDQVEAMTLAHRMIVMNGGIAEQVGTPQEVYDDPETMFVAGFIGSPPMNLIRGTVSPFSKPRASRFASRRRRLRLPGATSSSAFVPNTRRSPPRAGRGPSKSKRSRRSARTISCTVRCSVRALSSAWKTKASSPKSKRAPASLSRNRPCIGSIR